MVWAKTMLPRPTNLTFFDKMMCIIGESKYLPLFCRILFEFIAHSNVGLYELPVFVIKDRFII